MKKLSTWKRTSIKFASCYFIVLGFLAISSASANEALQRFFTEVQTVQAMFSQTVLDDAGESFEQQQGVFYLSRPGKFRWDYVNTGQQIIADGKNIYMYDADLEQVTVRSVQNALDQIPSMLLVNNGVDIEKYFKVSSLPSEQDFDWVLLEPKQDEAGYNQLKIGFSNNQLFAIHLQDALGNDTRLQLSKVQQNIPLAASLFKFVAPEGADVLTDSE